MVTTGDFFPLYVRTEIAPLFEHLAQWLDTERARLHRSALTCSGGYDDRLIKGSTVRSNHSWGLAADFCVSTNPWQQELVTDMPPGTSAKARSLCMRWGGDYARRKDPMHVEFMGTPDDARALVSALLAAPPSPPTETEELDMDATTLREIVREEVDRAVALVIRGDETHPDNVQQLRREVAELRTHVAAD